MENSTPIIKGIGLAYTWFVSGLASISLGFINTSGNINMETDDKFLIFVRAYHEKAAFILLILSGVSVILLILKNLPTQVIKAFNGIEKIYQWLQCKKAEKKQD